MSYIYASDVFGILLCHKYRRSCLCLSEVSEFIIIQYTHILNLFINYLLIINSQNIAISWADIYQVTKIFYSKLKYVLLILITHNTSQKIYLYVCTYLFICWHYRVATKDWKASNIFNTFQRPNKTCTFYWAWHN